MVVVGGCEDIPTLLPGIVAWVFMVVVRASLGGFQGVARQTVSCVLLVVVVDGCCVFVWWLPEHFDWLLEVVVGSCGWLSGHG